MEEASDHHLGGLSKSHGPVDAQHRHSSCADAPGQFSRSMMSFDLCLQLWEYPYRGPHSAETEHFGSRCPVRGPSHFRNGSILVENDVFLKNIFSPGRGLLWVRGRYRWFIIITEIVVCVNADRIKCHNLGHKSHGKVEVLCPRCHFRRVLLRADACLRFFSLIFHRTSENRAPAPLAG